MAEKNKKRTRYFSNPAVQGKILLVAFFSAILLVGTCWVMSLRALAVTQKAAVSLAGSESVQNDLVVLFAQQKTVLLTQLAIYSLVSLALVSLATLFVSHHIGGPLNNLVNYCRGVVGGDVKPREVRFRKNDIPQDVASAFNDFQRHHGILKAGDGKGEKDDQAQ